MKRNLGYRAVAWVLRIAIHLFCKVDGEYEAIPEKGPLILAVNHVNFMDAPLIAALLHNRPLTVLAKEETWDNIFLGALFSVWEGIPIKRGEVDRKAFQAVMQALNEGKILALAPEGTRSGTGILRRGYPGIVVIAQKANVPILPVAIYGGESVWENMKRLRKTHYQIAVGRKFYVRQETEGFSREARQKIVDEVMHEIARLMPARYHGVYQGKVNQRPEYLNFTLDQNPLVN